MWLTHQQRMVAAEGVLLILLVIPTPADSLQQNWVDQIVQRVQAEHDSISPQHVEFYLTQLQAVRQALGRGNVNAVQAAVTDLVRMVATKQGGLSDPTAQSLLLYISEVTPVEYLDETTKSRFHLIRQMAAFRAESIAPEESSEDVTVTPQTGQWNGWMRIGTVHPIVTLGAEILALIAFGVIVLLFVGAGGVGARRPF
jgi:hypothetical protein